MVKEESNDVDLEAILADESLDIEPDGASAEKTDNDDTTKDVEQAKDEASPRAQERIRELVEENRILKESTNLQSSTDLDKFINSIEDEPSRNLLKQFGHLVREDARKEYAPVLEDYNASRFEKEFSSYESKIPALATHKDEIRKTFLRNPSQSLKALVGDTLLEIQSLKIKPLDNSSSVASRTKQDLPADASKEDLYDILESRPPIS